MNLYDQLLTLQRIDNAFTEWEAYRSDLTDYILRSLPKDETLAIFGAGRCNDIDLKKLSSHFSAIILIDKDEEAMKEALHQYDLEHSPLIHTQLIDFVGISSNDYRYYADYLINEVRKQGIHTVCEDLAEVALELLEDLYRKAIVTPVNLEKNSYENAIVMGIHSQLISMLEWIWSIILQTIGQDESEVRDALTKMNDGLVEKFNHLVLEATKHIVIMGYEETRRGRLGAIQGAHQAMEDMKRRASKGKVDIADSITLNWPFNLAQGITYTVKVQKIYPLG